MERAMGGRYAVIAELDSSRRPVPRRREDRLRSRPRRDYIFPVQRVARRLDSKTTRGLARPVLLLRLVAFCLALSLSGVVHFMIDLWLDSAAAAQHFSEDSDDDGDRECPPGCGGCHCMHVSPVLPVPFAALGISKLLPAFEVTWAPYRSTLPPLLAPPGIYRPPRA